MPDGPYATPEEERLLQMIDRAGSPEGAGSLLLARLEVLEAAVEALERHARAQAAATASEPAAEEASAPPAPNAE